ncbi:hypothetical protein [Thermaerobacter composti]|uniref:ABC-2 type transport system permease protein n=1 Tax=Thermaerobacter composti TaxID=554949 RepID=A0ABZ0QPF9_9FIRM|nr:hypothetical protein [Thermaerobacter composti]WPD18647.1 hypothetical protein Q5761_09820 [Thermaerobacter composti]
MGTARWWRQALWAPGSGRALRALVRFQARQLYLPPPDLSGHWLLNAVLGFLGLMATSWLAGDYLYDRLAATGHARLWLPLVLALLSLAALAAGLSGLGSLFFQLRDLPLVAALPVAPGVLGASKLLVALIGQWLTLAPLAFALVPGALAQGFGAAFWALAVPVLLLLPLPPLAVAALVLMAIARLVPAHRQRDALAVIAGLASLVIIVPVLQVGLILPDPLHSRGPSGLEPAAQASWDALAARWEAVVAHGLPHGAWAAQALAPGTGGAAAALGGLAGLAAVSLATGLVAVLVAGVALPRALAAALTAPRAGGAPGQRPGRIGSRFVPEIGRRRSAFRALVARELAVWRTPQEMLALVVNALLFPFVFSRGSLVDGGPSLRQLAGAAGAVGPSGELTPGVAWQVLAAVAMATVVPQALVVARAAVSAEGRRLWLSLAIPVAPTAQVAAKLVVQTAMGLVVALPLAVVWGLRSGMHPLAWACVLVMVPGTLAMMNAASLLMDAARPELDSPLEDVVPRRFGWTIFLLWSGWMLALALATLVLQSTGSGPLVLAGLAACVLLGVGVALRMLHRYTPVAYRRIVPPA